MSSKLGPIYALIVDMDNTLYDWAGYFVPALDAMVGQAARLLEVEESRLRRELRRVHVSRGNTEHPFALLETWSVRHRFSDLNRRQQYERLLPAFEAFNEVRAKRMRLYPNVAETLASIRAQGCRVVGHTEATDVNIASPVKALDLQKFIEAVAAPRFSGLPHPLADSPRPAVDRVEIWSLPDGTRKPDPQMARAIAEKLKLNPGSCLYVGDSLSKDVAMAKQAGMMAAWARYGALQERSLWRGLVDVSHWDQRTVSAAERTVPDPADIQPDVVLDSFDELLTRFAFGRGDLPVRGVDPSKHSQNG